MPAAGACSQPHIRTDWDESHCPSDALLVWQLCAQTSCVVWPSLVPTHHPASTQPAAHSPGCEPNLPPSCPQVFSLQQGRRDIDAIYSMGLFEDVAMRPQPAEGSSLENPKVGPCSVCFPEAAAHDG